MENIGQFASKNGNYVLAAVDNKGTEIFYTTHGFTYQYRKPVEVPNYLVQKTPRRNPTTKRKTSRKLSTTRCRFPPNGWGASAAAIRLDSLQTPLFHYAAEEAKL
ncbi:MAG: hypothetical protein IPP17_24700 [Bacteroidetes bacterium]|nr:hypothetical protein [Bacteroidota bacterium]